MVMDRVPGSKVSIPGGIQDGSISCLFCHVFALLLVLPHCTNWKSLDLDIRSPSYAWSFNILFAIGHCSLNLFTIMSNASRTLRNHMGLIQHNQAPISSMAGISGR